MPFLPPESTTYINVKLTDMGRRMLSLGQLQFASAVISDREIDYSIDRDNQNGLTTYDITRNRVLAPVGDYPNIDPENLDGTLPISFTNQTLQSVKQFTTAQTATYGFFTGSTNNWEIITTSDRLLGTRTNITAGFGTDTITITGLYPIKTGDTVFIPWIPDQYPEGENVISPANVKLYSGSPANGLWYRIYSATTVVDEYVLDRPTPELGSPGKNFVSFYYPYNAVEDYFGSGSTQQTKFWNMNIVRPYDVAGTDTTIAGVSGYSSYGSIEYAGTKTYLGFDESYTAIGFIHYTNKFSGLTYGEQLIEKSIIVNMPTIMWNGYPANNGEGSAYGLTLYDSYGNTQYDSAAKTTYRELRDGIQSTNKIVGRVYHKLQLFVITDQDLLMALSFKGNRSYTLPEPILNLVTNPKAPLTTSDVTGLCESGKTYFVTYLVEADPYNATRSFGYTYPIHCGHIKQIDGEVDINGNPQYLSIQFPTNSFPYMRNDANIVASGSGWNANRVKILVNEQDKSFDYKPGNVPATDWVVLSGQGIYDCTTTSPATNTIDPVVLNSYQFIVSREDYISGTTNGNYVMWSGHTQYTNSSNFGFNFGDESFFFGTIDAQVLTTTYKTIMTVIAANYEYNQSNNETFDSLTDNATYITEVAILDNQNNTVAVGKPTYPLKKADSRYLAFQLIIDF
jgi:hypothetical protein